MKSLAKLHPEKGIWLTDSEKPTIFWYHRQTHCDCLRFRVSKQCPRRDPPRLSAVELPLMRCESGRLRRLHLSTPLREFLVDQDPTIPKCVQGPAESF